jgi:hypothetical protein
MENNVSGTTHRDLLAFQERHGISVDENFPPLALARGDALEFMRLLRSLNQRPVGIELWRHTARGYDVDGLGGWYSVIDDEKENFDEAVEYLSRGSFGDMDRFFVQYEDMNG